MSGERSFFDMNRRTFFQYVGAGAVASGLPFFRAQAEPAPPKSWLDGKNAPAWREPARPVVSAARPNQAPPAKFYVSDRLMLPQEFVYNVVAGWGERFGAAGHEIRFGFNNDYTGLLPIPGSKTDYYLFVNHEDISSRPWLQGLARFRDTKPFDLAVAAAAEDERQAMLHVAGTKLKGNAIAATDFDKLPAPALAELRRLCETALDDLGISILRVRRDAQGRFSVVRDAVDHRRFSAHSHYNVSTESSGAAAFFDGPAAFLFKAPPRGTFGNCSGATTPWGSFLTCEENIQNHLHAEVTPDGRESETSRRGLMVQVSYKNGKVDNRIPEPNFIYGLGHGLAQPLDGREYGWVCEFDPATGRMTKHTALGRFRHENVALRVVAQQPLAAYMGDDRRGGHIWKFVSRDKAKDQRGSPALLSDGTLYAARFKPGFAGKWLPLVPETKLRRPQPDRLSGGKLQLPLRPQGGAVMVASQADEDVISVDQWVAQVEAFCKKPFASCTLGDLVGGKNRAEKQGLLVLDAFLAANAIGATPASRPEDLEVHPQDGSVYIAFTDHTGGSEGSPNKTVFEDAVGAVSRRYGGIYRLIEANNNPAATQFSWGKYVSSGEVCDAGGGFACPDNLAFDPAGNLWLVTDVSTSTLNRPNAGGSESQQPGGKRFPGVFGNNAMFVVPCSGAARGVPHCFAVGPIECELTGPTFAADGQTLILSVQHPGEIYGTRRAGWEDKNKTFHIRTAGGEKLQQEREIPRGSNWPSDQLDTPPRPCVVSIVRRSD